MTLIEIRPHRWGWEVFEAPAFSLCSSRKMMQSITHGIAHAFAQARFAFWIQAAMSNALFRSTTRIGSCDVAVRGFDEAGNVIETREQASDFKRR
jgi:hypothetical protein